MSEIFKINVDKLKVIFGITENTFLKLESFTQVLRQTLLKISINNDM